MPTDLINIFEPSWEDERDSPPGFRSRRLYLARTLGSDQLGVSLWEIDLGESNMPYHAHHANEELLIVLAGTPTLRTTDGERELQPGNSVLFRRGEAHQLTNRSDGPVRFLFIAPLTLFAGRPTSGRGEFTLLKVVNDEVSTRASLQPSLLRHDRRRQTGTDVHARERLRRGCLARVVPGAASRPLLLSKDDPLGCLDSRRG